MKERITIDVMNNKILGELEKDFEWFPYKQIHSQHDFNFLLNLVLTKGILTDLNAIFYEDEVLLYLNEVSSYTFIFKNVECRLLVNKDQVISSIWLETNDLKILFLLIKRLQTYSF